MTDPKNDPDSGLSIAEIAAEISELAKQGAGINGTIEAALYRAEKRGEVREWEKSIDAILKDRKNLSLSFFYFDDPENEHEGRPYANKWVCQLQSCKGQGLGETPAAALLAALEDNKNQTAKGNES